MNEITFCDLREKEVINTIDGKKLGRVVDLVMTCSGDVLGIVVPGERKLLRALSSCDTLFVPWKCIVKIGEDALLVKLVGNATGAVCGSTSDSSHDNGHGDNHGHGHGHDNGHGNNCVDCSDNCNDCGYDNNCGSCHSDRK